MTENDYATSFAIFTNLMRDAAWQSQLRRSVSLYLALGRQPVNAQELEAVLQRTEEELVQYLLQGERPTDQALKHARRVLHTTQHALLRSEEDVQQLLRALATDLAIFDAVQTTATIPTPLGRPDAERPQAGR